MADETPQDAPAFVTDEATSAGTEQLSVAPDQSEGAVDGVAQSGAPAADTFEVEDAITKTAIDGADAQQSGSTEGRG